MTEGRISETPEYFFLLLLQSFLGGLPFHYSYLGLMGIGIGTHFILGWEATGYQTCFLFIITSHLSSLQLFGDGTVFTHRFVSAAILHNQVGVWAGKV